MSPSNSAASAAPSFDPFRPADIDAGLALSRAERWPHRREDWELVAAISRGTVIRDRGEVAGTAVWMPYGERLAAVGMVMVAAGQRGRGFGRALMERTIVDAGGRTLRLVATHSGLPLYEKLGFAATGTVFQHQGVPQAAPAPDGVEEANADDRAAILALDRTAFGGDRTDLLGAMLRRGVALVVREGGVTGFAIRRMFGLGWTIGPVIAPDRDHAQRLIAAHVAALDGAFVRVDTTDTALADWLERQGLPRAGSGTAMMRGTVPEAAPERFALASQALG
ncbi:GNAT family N-acetyltransferase [Acuticoccus sediminis]|uniref:GNAT family N-acetyltransferase n=1 Tax=Acuticoccus sediminis TaxID=2184697 RepID=A0A8B2NJM0_9HYPH|nr:GNAT family N-acetyltransferase [Acuticoccus sediminis]RAH98476.1 GNAT family N-acetyltransferase [Acuticoccus sediminis]